MSLLDDNLTTLAHFSLHSGSDVARHLVENALTKFSSWFIFIVCDNILRWLSQAYHNPPLYPGLGQAVNGALTEFSRMRAKNYQERYKRKLLILFHINSIFVARA